MCVGVHDGLMMNAYAVEMSLMKFTVLIKEYLVRSNDCLNAYSSYCTYNIHVTVQTYSMTYSVSAYHIYCIRLCIVSGFTVVDWTTGVISLTSYQTH